MVESKYGKYILKEPRGTFTPPPKKETQVRGVSITEDLLSAIGGINCNFNFMGVIAPHLMVDPPHKHEYDEFLFFIASDPMNAPDLGGEVEIALGEEWEKHTITTSSFVCLPRGVQHCPIYVKKVNRPFYFGHIMAAPKYSSSASPQR
jgi:hypothetical protein